MPHALLAGLRADLERPPADTGDRLRIPRSRSSAPSTAIHASLPIYSGGLGALAGDLVKEASDRALPLVAVGLMYRKGYFRQRIDAIGLAARVLDRHRSRAAAGGARDRARTASR